MSRAVHTGQEILGELRIQNNVAMIELKLVVMGSATVGKTALIQQYLSGKFVEKYDPTMEDYYRKETDIDDTPVMLEIKDTAGVEQFVSMRDVNIKNGEGFILVYSIINAATFSDVQSLRNQIARVKGGLSSPITLVGTMCDMEGERAVTTQAGERLAHEWRCSFCETSAKTGHNVKAVFEETARKIMQVKENNRKVQKRRVGSSHGCVCL